MGYNPQESLENTVRGAQILRELIHPHDTIPIPLVPAIKCGTLTGAVDPEFAVHSKIYTPEV